MATSWPLKIRLDQAESRIDLNRLAASVDGTNWDRAASDTTIYFDPVTNTAMLAPLPLTSAWETTFTGNYARLGQTDLVLTTPALWALNQIRAAGDYWHEGLGTNERVETRGSLPINQAMYVAAFVDGIGSNSRRVVLECGWSYGASDGIAVKLHANGTYSIHKGGVQVGEYTPEAASRTTQRVAKAGQTSRRKFVSMTMIPCRFRDLLIIDDNGSGICHTFSDLPDWYQGAAQPTITPSGPFYILIPNGKPVFQLAQVKYETAGNIYSKPQRCRFAWPSAYSTPNNRYYHHDFGAPGTAGTMTFSLVKEDFSAMVYTGTVDTVRVKIAMSADGVRNMGLYSADVYAGPTYTNTYNANIDVTCDVEALNVAVDENGRTTVQMSARRKELADAGVDRPETTGNRPFLIAVQDDTTPTPNEIAFAIGTFDPPEIEYFAGDETANQDLALLKFSGQDLSGIMDRSWIVQPLPYDNVTIDAVVDDLVSLGGFNPALTTVDVTTSPVKLAASMDISLGKYTSLPDRGDTVGKWLEKIHSEYCSTWIRGWMPRSGGYTYRFVDIEATTPTSKLTLYASIDDATTAGVTAALRPSRIYRSFSELYERPEANQIMVVGQDPHTGEVIADTWNDSSSQDPDLAPASRPKNWLGATEPVLYEDPALHTRDAVENIGLVLAQRITTGRQLIEWESDFLVNTADNVPIWIGDVVTIFAPNNTSKGAYRIVAIPSIEFVSETTDRFRVRNARYRAVRLINQSLQGDDPGNSGSFIFP